MSSSLDGSRSVFSCLIKACRLGGKDSVFLSAISTEVELEDHDVEPSVSQLSNALLSPHDSIPMLLMESNTIWIASDDFGNEMTVSLLFRSLDELTLN